MSSVEDAGSPSFVRTVTGDVEPERLGVTYCHEHLLTSPSQSVTDGTDDLVLDDEERALAELNDFAMAGGGAIVDVTTPEFGRNPRGLRSLSDVSGVRVIATTGHVTEDFWRDVLPLEHMSEDDLAAEMIADLTEGMDGTSIRAGIIKAGSSRGHVTPAERRILRSAAAAQRATGAPITTHTTAGTAAMAQVKILRDAGADLHHVCIGHLDRRLVWEEHLGIARAGVFLGYDQISKEKYEPDLKRVRFIARLTQAGFGDRIVLSGDLARRSYLRAWGGAPGYAYILGPFRDMLQAAGIDSTSLLLAGNPAHLLTWRR
jgi:predicted metal-dependent phosphotriesterase family hydrolase